MAEPTLSGVPASPRAPARRPLAIAMAISAAIHVAIVLGVSVRTDFTPARMHDMPVLDVVVADPGRADSPVATVAGSDDPQAAAAAAEQSPREAGAGRKPAPRRAPAPVGRAEQAPASTAGAKRPDAFETVTDRPAAADTPSPGSSPAPGESDRLPLVAATIPAAVKTAPLTRRERKMLSARLEDWAASYETRYRGGEEITWKHRGQEYAARFRSIPGGDDTELDRLAVEVTTIGDGHSLSTVVQMKRLAFSNYAQFVNRWDGDVQIHDDELDGRFHSNSAINLSYSRKVHPRFHGKVTTSARRINIAAGSGQRRREDIFMGGVETGVRAIRLPKDYVPLPASLAIRDEQRQEFTEDTRITFHADGTYTWVSTESGLFERRGTIRSPATYLLAKGKAALDIQGTVNGKVLVYSGRRITISGDLIYATGPAGDRDLDDYIGIVSEGSVDIAEPGVTGPGDLTVHGAIYARRLFRVRDYRRRGGGTLRIFGSLTAGSLTATEPRFATEIDFDPRLEERRPPGFPVTDLYEVEDWNGAWTVAAAGARDGAAPQRPPPAKSSELLR